MTFDISKMLKYCIFILFIIAGTYVSIKYLIPIMMPFMIAYLISRIVRPISKKIRMINERIDKPATALILIVLSFSMFFIFKLFFSLLIDQLSATVDSLSLLLSSEDNPFTMIANKITSLAESHPLINRLLYVLSDPAKDESAVSDAAASILSSMTSAIAQTVSGLFSAIPSLIVAFFITISASFYMCLDRGETLSFIRRLIPPKVLKKIDGYKTIVAKSSKEYVKMNFLMMLIVFAVSYLGLTFLRVDFALVKSLGIAFVDLLPILGAGTVLVPWAFADLLLGNFPRAVSLLILLLIITIVRELAGPKIIGSYIGAPPIIALFSVYIGMKLFGFIGLILFPIITSVASSAFNEYNKKPRPKSG